MSVIEAKSGMTIMRDQLRLRYFSPVKPRTPLLSTVVQNERQSKNSTTLYVTISTLEIMRRGTYWIDTLNGWLVTVKSRC